MRSRLAAAALLTATLLGLAPGLVRTGTPAPETGLAAEELARVLTLSPLPPPPRDPTNAVESDPRAARLGRMIFFDPRFSGRGDTSCASCHDPARAWGDGLPLARGTEELARHTPTLLNVAQHRWYFWDGRKDSLWSQALGPLEDPREHGASRMQLVHLLIGDTTLGPLYEEIFGALPDVSDPERFPARGRPVPGNPEHPDALGWNAMAAEDRARVDQAFANLGKALAAFQRGIEARNSRFDVFVEGIREGDPEKVAALGEPARRGLKLFLGRARCVTCHDGPFFSDLEFHDARVPTGEGERDPGRYEAVARVLEDPFNGLGVHSSDPHGAGRTKLGYLARTPSQRGRLKTPTLRNVAVTGPYMHGGQFETLEELVHFYSTLEGALPATGGEKLLVPLGLSGQEESDLVAFLKTLTDTSLEAASTPRP